MRWKHKDSSWPTLGEIETATWFAWLPVTIGLETRWLELVRVRSKYFREGDWEYLMFVDLRGTR